MACGVYEILNASNGRLYIGSSVDVKKRLRIHERELKNGSHGNSHLQHAWNKYGPEAFCFFQVEACRPPELLEKEQFWMDACRTHDRLHGYNICAVAGNTLGRKHTDAAKRKMSAAMSGRKLSEEHKRKISESGKGRILSKETRAKMAESSRGRKLTDEQKAKISASSKGHKRWVGKRHTEETKKKMALVKIGKKHSAVAKANMSEGQKGRRHPQETIEKMKVAKGGKRNPMYGRAHSAATKKKIGEARRRSAKERRENSPTLRLGVLV